jgi:hypothetical protein
MSSFSDPEWIKHFNLRRSANNQVCSSRIVQLTEAQVYIFYSWLNLRLLADFITSRNSMRYLITTQRQTKPAFRVFTRFLAITGLLTFWTVRHKILVSSHNDKCSLVTIHPCIRYLRVCPTICGLVR